MGIVNPGTLIIRAMLVGHPVRIVAHLAMGGFVRCPVGSHHRVMAPAVEIIALMEAHGFGIKALQTVGGQIKGLIQDAFLKRLFSRIRGVLRRYAE
ncbi:hypothetical protein H206_00883 [Candidatus Electrothrix aarhusensis]|uniref:Uncharacterized protein n=1 Tax=Candidatus Electrothrix aarhusensis TaxID=1859131 RepID=A0A3S3QJW4_9BACT|nr:hypothetical protein H206_00883 [Candidatus Electrothrix aarhusensis]